MPVRTSQEHAGRRIEVRKQENKKCIEWGEMSNELGNVWISLLKMDGTLFWREITLLDSFFVSFPKVCVLWDSHHTHHPAHLHWSLSTVKWWDKVLSGVLSLSSPPESRSILTQHQVTANVFMFLTRLCVCVVSKPVCVCVDLPLMWPKL